MSKAFRGSVRPPLHNVLVHQFWLLRVGVVSGLSSPRAGWGLDQSAAREHTYMHAYICTDKCRGCVRTRVV